MCIYCAQWEKFCSFFFALSSLVSLSNGDKHLNGYSGLEEACVMWKGLKMSAEGA